MSKQISFSNFLDKLEEYENAIWCTPLISNGRKALLSVYNNIDNEQLTNLTDTFIQFVSLLSQCHSDSLSDKKHNFTLSEKTSEEQNKSQDLLPKNDIIQMVNSDLQCPICNEWLYRATSANCNHTFCESCINKWIKIKKTCPVCRTPVQYLSTSIAVDNFISNLCQLFGGFFKEQRELIQNAECSIDDNMDPSYADLIQMDDLSTNAMYEDVNDTYLRQMEFGSLVTSNVVPLIPASRSNPRPMDTLNTLHSNRVPLLRYPESSVATIRNQPQPTSSRSIANSFENTTMHTFNDLSISEDETYISQSEINTSIRHPNEVPLIPANPVPMVPHSNRVPLLRFPEIRTLSVTTRHNNRQ